MGIYEYRCKRLTQSSDRSTSVSPSSYNISNVASFGIAAVIVPGNHSFSTIHERERERERG
jgi:hypothetical protein